VREKITKKLTSTSAKKKGVGKGISGTETKPYYRLNNKGKWGEGKRKWRKIGGGVGRGG